MPDKYVRISTFLHERLKVKAAKLHMTIKDLADSYIWEILRRDEKPKKKGKKKDEKIL